MIELRPDARASRIDGCIVLTMEDGDLAVLNEEATLVLDELLHGASCGEIAAKMANLFDVDCRTASRDILSFVDDMDAHQLLKGKQRRGER